jgi:hypothetical protein
MVVNSCRLEESVRKKKGKEAFPVTEHGGAQHCETISGLPNHPRRIPDAGCC